MVKPKEIKFRDLLGSVTCGSTVRAEICLASDVSFQLNIPDEERFDMLMSLLSDKLLGLRVEGMEAKGDRFNILLENADLLRPEDFKDRNSKEAQT